MKFGVILLDPPWHFKTRSSKGRGRAPEKHYKDESTLSDEQILSLPLQSLMADDCVIICWGMWSKLFFFFDVPQRWGVKYSSSGFVWAKTNRGVKDNYFANVYDTANWAVSTGYGTRKNTEFALAFTKGSPKRISKSVRELVIAPRGKPSEKPERIHRDIEALYPGPYLEIFARKTRSDLAGDWTFVGNEIDGQDIFESLPKLAAAETAEAYYGVAKQ